MHIPLKRGMLIRHQNHVYSVAEFQERRTGKQRATVHVTLRDVRDGHQVDRTLGELEPIEEVPHASRSMQYLYARGDERVFMDAETFDEFELGPAQLHGCEPFLKEGETYRVLFIDNHPLSLEMPDVVRLAVVETAAPAHSVGGASNVQKEATLENELVVNVPLFIRVGDTLRVDTRTKTYVGKE
ncbi:MAG: elongation factor P [Phycisphaerae bacterium]|nr:elongation factor P [Phycisphaerae bacterium]